MTTPRRSSSQRHRRHADRPRPWTQFPWTILGMAFITALFLASYQTGAVSKVDTGVRVPYDQTRTR